MSAANELAYHAGLAAYLACLETGNAKHRTRNIGLPRDAYASEFAKAAQVAVERAVQRFFASCDTHPKGGDVQRAPFMSGAVPKADAQTPPRSEHKGSIR